VFATARTLAASYMDAYVDLTGRVTGFAVADLRDLGDYDWRLSPKNVWKVERWLLEYPHHKLTMSDRRYHALHERYKRYKERHPDKKPVYYDNRRTWM
jgi:phosphatidylserine/phosphatidylglycerophosphate/cardiolipin synthase-like enzyme